MEEDLSSGAKKEKLRLYLLLIGRDRHGEPCLQVRTSWVGLNSHSPVTPPPSAQVNFDEGTVMLFKEVRNLQNLGFRVPAAIKHLSDEVSHPTPILCS